MKNSKLMQAAFVDNKVLSLRFDVLIPKPSENEVLLKVLVAGVCATDLAIIKGYADFTGTPGHEFVGVITELGASVDKSWLGKRVVAEINQWCGHCEYCINKHYSHCCNREVIGIRGSNGAFAEYLVVKVSTLFSVPDNIPNEQAVFIEPLAAAFRILEQTEEIKKTKNILIIGAGKLGQLIARVMALTESKVSVTTRYVKQRRLLKDINIHCMDESNIQAMKYDVVIETSGNVSGFEQAIKACCSLGHIILKSTYVPNTLDLSQIVIRELTIIGSRCGSFDKAIAALETKQIDPTCLIDKLFALSNIENAFKQAKQKGAMKILLKP